jgi:large subunit ribosomal protein L3
MTVSLVGQKCGMTRVFIEDGTSIPVTVLEILPNRVTQVKTVENDGYQAIQITTGLRKRSKINMAQAGHFAKANVEPGKGLWEFRVDNLEDMIVGLELNVNIFSEGQMVDVTGTSKGKGFAGTIKRHNFTMGDATHGNSLSHRAPGSIGQRQSPGKVFKGKKMSGHMGDVRTTVLSQQIVKVYAERNLVLVKGAVPGAPGSKVVIRPAIKVKKEETK